MLWTLIPADPKGGVSTTQSKVRTTIKGQKETLLSFSATGMLYLQVSICPQTDSNFIANSQDASQIWNMTFQKKGAAASARLLTAFKKMEWSDIWFCLKGPCWYMVVLFSVR